MASCLTKFLFRWKVVPTMSGSREISWPTLLIPFARSKSFAFRRTALAGYSFPERGNYARVRSEERRLGKECRSRGSPYNKKEKEGATRQRRAHAIENPTKLTEPTRPHST